MRQRVQLQMLQGIRCSSQGTCQRYWRWRDVRRSATTRRCITIQTGGVAMGKGGSTLMNSRLTTAVYHCKDLHKNVLVHP